MIPREDLIRMALEAGFRAPVPADGYMGLAYDQRVGAETGASLERFAALVEARVVAAEREACARTRNTKPRELKPVGTGAFLADQQYCYEKGWREGVAALRKAIRARGAA